MSDEYMAAVRKFQPDELTLWTGAYWTVLLRAKQVTLGSLVLLPTRPAADFSDVPADVGANLFQVVSDCQKVLREKFSPDRFNLIAAMMKDPFVHFHLIPRYEEARTFAKMAWVDQDWPRLVSFRNVDTENEVQQEVLTELRAGFDGLVTT